MAERLSHHNSGFYKGSYTTQSTDWEVFLSIDCSSFSQARKMESHIKKMKSRKYLANLKTYPEMIQKLLALE